MSFVNRLHQHRRRRRYVIAHYSITSAAASWVFLRTKGERSDANRTRHGDALRFGDINTRTNTKELKRHNPLLGVRKIANFLLR